jgi:PAS domain S-box-containing protein
VPQDRPTPGLEAARTAVLLSELAGRLLEDQDVDAEALPAFFAALPDDLGVDVAFSCMPVEARAGEAQRLVFHYGFDEALAGDSVSERAVYVEDVQSSSDSRHALIRSAGLRAYASEPLVAGGELFGALSFGSRTRDRFAPEDLAFFGAVARHVALARRRAKAARETAEELAALNRLQEVSGVLVRVADVDSIFGHILDAAVAIMRADCASIQALDPETGALKLLDWRGFHPESAAHWREVDLDSNSSCGGALRCGTRVVVSDVANYPGDLGARNLEEYERCGIQAMQSTPLLSRSGELVGMISTHWRRPHAPSERELRLLDVLVRQAADAVERTRTRIALEASETRLKRLTEALTSVVWWTDAAGAIVSDNPGWSSLTGRPFDAIKGDGWLEDVHPEDRPRVGEAWAAALAGRTAYACEYRLRCADGQYRLMSTRGAPVLTASGEILEWIGASTDVTEARAAEDRERLLMREVDHRAKNLLAVVQSIVQLSRADSPGGLAKAVTGRIQALARAHSLLAASRWEGADLQRLAADELAPYLGGAGARVRLHGPALKLKPAAAQALALVIHELATNAAKHGALSADAGRVEVTWALSVVDGGRDRLLLRWRERDGPAVRPPARRGFGSTVIRSSVEQQLKGVVSFDWGPGGLKCEASLPVADLIAETAGSEAQLPPEATASAPVPARPFRRILLVEDEALIALQAEAALTAAGCAVVGPAARVADAFDLFYAQEVDAALLDINVAGESVSGLADLLAAKGVPFAFCTGYGDVSTLPAGHRSAPRIAKPFTLEQLLDVFNQLSGEPGSVRAVGA